MSHYKAFKSKKTESRYNAKAGKFNRRKLPAPIAVLYQLNIQTGRVNQGGYWVIRCPFHKGGAEQHPSLNLHQVNGNYLCHACGAKGGDILAFFRQVTGVNFVEAAKRLGAWGYDAE